VELFWLGGKEDIMEIRFPGWDKQNQGKYEDGIKEAARAVLGEGVSFDESTPVNIRKVASLVTYLMEMVSLEEEIQVSEPKSNVELACGTAELLAALQARIDKYLSFCMRNSDFSELDRMKFMDRACEIGLIITAAQANDLSRLKNIFSGGDDANK
jgi:hypothetical protein